MSCPICSKASDLNYRPFCSKRCADIDLGRWLGEGYAVPSAEPLTEAELDQIETHSKDLH